MLNEERVSSYSSVTLSSPLCLRALLFLKFNSNYSKVSEERERERENLLAVLAEMGHSDIM